MSQKNRLFQKRGNKLSDLLVISFQEKRNNFLKRKDSSNCAGLRFGFAVIEYDILRVIVTLLVIIGHCTYFRILTPYGGCDYTEFTFPSTSMFYRITEYASTLIYKFHMPLYMALSGALFRMKNSRGGGTHLIEV